MARRDASQDDLLDLLWPAIRAEYPDGITLEQIGVLLGLTRERIRQIEMNAFAKIRQFVADERIEIDFGGDTSGESWMRVLSRIR